MSGLPEVVRVGELLLLPSDIEQFIYEASICLFVYRGSAIEHVLYFKCHRKYYNGSATENTDLDIFCDTCLQ